MLVEVHKRHRGQRSVGIKSRVLILDKSSFLGGISKRIFSVSTLYFKIISKFYMPHLNLKRRIDPPPKKRGHFGRGSEFFVSDLSHNVLTCRFLNF